MKKQPITLLAFLFIAFFSGSFAAEWQPLKGFTGGRVNALAANNAYLFAATQAKGVFRSSDNGTTWTAMNSGLSDLNVLSLLVRGPYVFAGTQNNGMFRSADSGKSWVIINSGLSAWTVKALAANSVYVFAGTGGGYVSRSSDNGNRWETVSKGLIFANIYSLGVNPTYIFAGTWGGSAFRSEDNGDNWFLVTNGWADPRKNLIPYCFAMGDTFHFAGLGGNGIFRAKDSARAWFQMNTGLPDSAFVTALALTGKNLFAATQKGVYRSINNAESWVAESNKLTDTVAYAFAASGNNLFAGTGSGMWRLPLTGLKTEQAVAAAPKSGIQLRCQSPLTAQPTLYFGTGNQRGQVTVYTLSGKKIFSKEVHGQGTLTWNSKNQPSGVYFARLRVGAAHSDVSMVLTK